MIGADRFGIPEVLFNPALLAAHYPAAAEALKARRAAERAEGLGASAATGTGAAAAGGGGGRASRSRPSTRPPPTNATRSLLRRAGGGRERGGAAGHPAPHPRLHLQVSTDRPNGPSSLCPTLVCLLVAPAAARIARLHPKRAGRWVPAPALSLLAGQALACSSRPAGRPLVLPCAPRAALACAPLPCSLPLSAAPAPRPAHHSLTTPCRCDVDIRKDLFGGIVLTGGTAGFAVGWHGAG